MMAKTYCAWCKKIMSDSFPGTIDNHGLCPECRAKYFPEFQRTDRSRSGRSKSGTKGR